MTITKTLALYRLDIALDAIAAQGKYSDPRHSPLYRAVLALQEAIAGVPANGLLSHR